MADKNPKRDEDKPESAKMVAEEGLSRRDLLIAVGRFSAVAAGVLAYGGFLTECGGEGDVGWSNSSWSNHAGEGEGEPNTGAGGSGSPAGGGKGGLSTAQGGAPGAGGSITTGGKGGAVTTGGKGGAISTGSKGGSYGTGGKTSWSNVVWSNVTWSNHSWSNNVAWGNWMQSW